MPVPFGIVADAERALSSDVRVRSTGPTPKEALVPIVVETKEGRAEDGRYGRDEMEKKRRAIQIVSKSFYR
ncbi:hypothetical protein GWI33_003812 [Rhynchophorus ferrugineus]|uniref:Uncharacterized protein n=1 Tax=Rhynchophorus ferrugineus TaxID=354439 RepID=A0A834HJZ9_RHYFE|nr:hypothetical protein GWI33_003812 [Rhynchophorus ferrugineus]